MVPVTFSPVQGIPTKLQAPPLPPVVVKSSSKHYLIGSPAGVNTTSTSNATGAAGNTTGSNMTGASG